LYLDVSFKASDVFRNPLPALVALLSHAAWVVVTYFVTYAVLKSRERRR
jgi:hypothetical protein